MKHATISNSHDSARGHDPQRRGRIPVVRTVRVRWARVGPDRRLFLRGELFRIFSAYYEGFGIEAFESFFLDRQDVVLGLFYGADRQLAGFCSMRRSVVGAGGHRYGALSAGVYIDTRYRGGRVAAAFGLREAMRIKLRHPSVRLGYLGLAHTPAPYRLFCRTMPRVYPSRPDHSGEPPGDIAEVMSSMLDERGWPRLRHCPWAIATPMYHPRPDWLERKLGTPDDLDVQFFCERVPGWSRHGHALACWVPLELRDIAGASLRWRPGTARGRRSESEQRGPQ
ncbi:MAG: hypothetical protein AAF799_25560 [Myxococcota bacterium]